MSLQKNRPRTSELQRILNSFKQFERKFDKLQNDVSYHGQTLNELRSLLANLSSCTVSNPDVQHEPVKRVHTISTAVQSEPPSKEHVIAKQTKNSMRQFPSKTKAKCLINQTVNAIYEIPYINKLKASPDAKPVKRNKTNRGIAKSKLPVKLP
ncbi:DNA replication terminus site-binding protein [Operophtera brumata]|uniref:DNA replication terminus site-binding protein n=1 Tax=Operophtera brumata TaxID=104452 RepID=A0A0L7LET5_OPEBR|nr:DNA replication terminus site-binding protein [Operophtera brumata]